jgi:hypothetical protein
MTVLGDSSSAEEDPEDEMEGRQTEFCVLIGRLVKCQIPDCTGQLHCPYLKQSLIDDGDFYPGINSRSSTLTMPLAEALKLQQQLQSEDAEFCKLSTEQRQAKRLDKGRVIQTNHPLKGDRNDDSNGKLGVQPSS